MCRIQRKACLGNDIMKYKLKIHAMYKKIGHKNHGGVAEITDL